MENEYSITATQSKGKPETPVALIIEHEQAILSQLKAARDKAKLQLDIAKSQLITAKEQRAHAEYQRYLEETKRAIALQQQQIELERQRSIRAGQLQEREYSKAQIETKIQEVDNAIAQLSTVKAPYPGKIKKVKWTGQDNHNLTVQLTLDVDNGSEQSTVTSEQ
jgi:biotin carboxyl carrier protein